MFNVQAIKGEGQPRQWRIWLLQHCPEQFLERLILTTMSQAEILCKKKKKCDSVLLDSLKEDVDGIVIRDGATWYWQNKRHLGVDSMKV